MPKKKARTKAKPSAQKEQLRLLRLILAELQKMNAGMASATAAKPGLQEMTVQDDDEDGDPDAEELEYFE